MYFMTAAHWSGEHRLFQTAACGPTGCKTPLNEKSNWCDVVRDLHRGDERRARSCNGCCSSAFFSFHPRRLIIVIFNPSVWLECVNCIPVILVSKKNPKHPQSFFFSFCPCRDCTEEFTSHPFPGCSAVWRKIGSTDSISTHGDSKCTDLQCSDAVA